MILKIYYGDFKLDWCNIKNMFYGTNNNLKHTEFVCLYYKLVSNYS